MKQCFRLLNRKLMKQCIQLYSSNSCYKVCISYKTSIQCYIRLGIKNFHIQLQSMKQCIRKLYLQKVWSLPYPVTKYEAVYTSFILPCLSYKEFIQNFYMFHIQLQSMKQCIRLLKRLHPNFVSYKHPVTKDETVYTSLIVLQSMTVSL